MPHSGSTWTKTCGNTANHSHVLGTGLTDIDVQGMERLREENENLKTAMKEVRILSCGARFEVGITATMIQIVVTRLFG